MMGYDGILLTPFVAQEALRHAVAEWFTEGMI